MNQESTSEMSARRRSLFNGFDLSTNDGIHAVIREIETNKPQHVWMSPVCGPFLVMQNVKQRDEKQREELHKKRQHALKQYVGCSLIYIYIHIVFKEGYMCHGTGLKVVKLGGCP